MGFGTTMAVAFAARVRSSGAALATGFDHAGRESGPGGVAFLRRVEPTRGRAQLALGNKDEAVPDFTTATSKKYNQRKARHLALKALAELE